MSDQGEKTCPLCAEEMDLTDQQLKPCKCGYEICVWCWHHIMDMAEKDEVEGRCPACRTPYNKEKIVGMGANCERLVAEMNTERKLKSQKPKSKTTEGRRQLSSVRVIQRNLVYIVGLPLNLADEAILQRKEYFGQYGKVLKVSISRTASGAIQHFANNTCSVYITFSKEEEAVRCIQSVHGFVLEGKSLRVCFGTTKYCHAWLRNVPCNNPDCLYLHEVGSQEDSFTKDEVISAYTRSRVQQTTGTTNNMQKRSGNVLPQPMDEYSSISSTSGRPISKSSSNNMVITARGSPPNSSSGRSVTLPAAASWGLRASNSQPSSTSSACPNGTPKQKPETCSGSMVYSTAVAGTTQISTLQSDVGKKLNQHEETCRIQRKSGLEAVDSVRLYSDMDCKAIVCEALIMPGSSITSTAKTQCPTSKEQNSSLLPNISNSSDRSGLVCGAEPEKDLNICNSGKIRSLCTDMTSMNADRQPGNENHGAMGPRFSLPENCLIKSPGSWELWQHQPEKIEKHSASPVVGKISTSTADSNVAKENFDWKSDALTQLSGVDCHEGEEDVLSFDDERLKDPEDPQIIGKKVEQGSSPLLSGVSVVCNGYSENPVSSSADTDRNVECSYFLPNEERRKDMGGFDGEAASFNCNTVPDMGENRIISNILSMDCDAWDESLTSPQNLVRLFGESDKQLGSLKVSNSWKAQSSSQSRFSFARQEESRNQGLDAEPSFFSNISQVSKDHFFSRDLVENKDSYFDKYGNCNGFPSGNFGEPDNFTNSHSHPFLNKLSVSRPQISAPPGFYIPSRSPPPGFTSHERMDQAFDVMSGNHLFENSSLRNSYQAPSTGNVGGAGDLEFMDPAILAVGKGRIPSGLNNPVIDIRSNFSPQSSGFENEARLHLLMQRSLSLQQNLRLPDTGDNFSSLNDAYGIPSRVIEQPPSSNLSSFPQLSLQQSRNGLMSNGHRDGWNEVQSRDDPGMVDLLRAERLGFNKFYTGYEDSKFRMPSSGNLYNRTF